MGCWQLEIIARAASSMGKLARTLFYIETYFEASASHGGRGVEAVNVFLDDIRRAPHGFVRVRTVEETIELLKTGKVKVLSLDHDLGTWPITGYDVVRYMVEQRMYPRRIIVHSANPFGRVRMIRLLEQNKPDAVKIFIAPLPWQPSV